MKIVAVIPARYGSTRFPGKPLADLNGKPMVMHVFDAINPYFETYIATDSVKIALTTFELNARVLLVDEECENGTARVAKSLELLDTKPDIVINVQGDEPLVSALDVLSLAGKVLQDHVQIATLVTKVPADGKNIVRVITDGDECVEFSRCDCVKDQTEYRHLGMYAFEYDTLMELVKLQPSEKERFKLGNKLEQDRWLDHGYKIHFEEVETDSIGVDTPTDLEYVKQIIIKNAN